MIQIKKKSKAPYDTPKNILPDSKEYRYTIYIGDDLLYIEFDKVPNKVLTIDRGTS